MSFVGDLMGDVVGGITGAKQAGKAAEKAGDLQYQSAMAGVDETARQFDALVKLMEPFVNAGNQAIGAQGNLIGLNGAQAQQDAIAQLSNSPQMQALMQQGENAILQNASATGGLRGGNAQAALAQFRPEILNSMINQQFANLGGLSQLGQASAAGQASAGMNSASSIAGLLQQGGAAQAGGVMAKGSIARNTFNDMMALVSGGAKAMSGMGGF